MSFFSEYKQVNKLLQEKQQVVFYAESRHYYQYFKKMIDDLLATDTKICYITSDKNDPLLTNREVSLNVVYVKWLLVFLFSRIRADVMIMTMPDLDNYSYKRSAGVGTYIYVFHAAVSTHQQYRKQAFDNYDTIFCTGDYQGKEIRKTEELYDLKPKEIIRYGYPLLDEIVGKKKSINKKPTILVAPSWFEGCIFDICIEELLTELSRLPYDIILRSHPEYEKGKKKEFQSIQKFVKSYAGISFDTEANVIDRLPLTEILITDRSGIALEFAFGTGRPVLFIETALKQTNPDWNELDIEPLENSLRSKLGIAILPTELKQLPAKISELESLKNGFEEKMSQLKKQIFYNSDESYTNGLNYILSRLT